MLSFQIELSFEKYLKVFQILKKKNSELAKNMSSQVANKKAKYSKVTKGVLIKFNYQPLSKVEGKMYQIQKII